MTDKLPEAAETYVVTNREIRVSPTKFEELGLDPDDYTAKDWEGESVTTKGGGVRYVERPSAYRDGADRVIFPVGAPVPEALARELVPAFHERIEPRDADGEPVRWPFTYA